jgi:pimeloyl-ACP methyl ester carboxylesterase
MAISPRLATSTFWNIWGRGGYRQAAIASLVCAGLLFAAPAHAALRFKRCGDYGFACAHVSVPLDRTGAVPGKVSLLVKRVRARQRGGASLPPLFVLAGGPGQSATDAFSAGALSVLYPAYWKRDLIIFDQRGTGRSGLLRCRRLERVNLFKAGPAAAACARSLGARRAFYTTRETDDDIDAIRQALGTERIALFGTSYGTKVAVSYATRYPSHVERLVLDSVTPVDGPDPYYRDSTSAVPRVLRSLCGRVCAWTADPVDDLHRLVRRIGARGGTLRGSVVNADGRRRHARLSRVDVFSVLLAGDFDPTLRAAFPGAVDAALHGDAAPMLRLRRRAFEIDAAPPPPRELSSAVYAATTCEEVSMPWPRTTPPDPAERHRLAAANAAAIPDAQFGPFDRGTALESDVLELCESWPAAPVAPDLGSGPPPDVPVLLVEGADDLRTPLENAQHLAQSFPRARVVVAPDTGHSAIGNDFSGCAQRAFARFVQNRPVPSRCRRVRKAFPADPPPPRRLSAVLPLAGTPGIRGRALAAMKLTLRDVAEDSLTTLVFGSSDRARGGGLRAGRYRIGADNTLELDGVSFVPGVTVTGRIKLFLERRQSGRLRIGGRAAPRGALRIRKLRITGRLGGHRVRGTLRSPVAVTAGVRPLHIVKGSDPLTSDPPLSRLRERARTRLLF